MTQTTIFPNTACTADVTLQKALIKEEWQRLFTLIPYYSAKTQATKVTDPNTPSGEATATPFDTVWGEEVPNNMRTTWVQPHLSSTYNATDRGMFKDVVYLNARVQREAKDTDLKRWGFDKVRDLLLFIPIQLAEEAGVDPLKAGDYFFWQDLVGDSYDVQDANKDGWWFNTDIKFFWVLNCEHRRLGS